MDRGRKRPEGGDLEAGESELTGEPAVQPGPAEPDAGEQDTGELDAVPPAGIPRGSGPPEHWLAYVRARAPGLLRPGGSLATEVGTAAPDVVPHGRMGGAPSPPSSESIAAPVAGESSATLVPRGAERPDRAGPAQSTMTPAPADLERQRPGAQQAIARQSIDQGEPPSIDAGSPGARVPGDESIPGVADVPTGIHGSDGGFLAREHAQSSDVDAEPTAEAAPPEPVAAARADPLPPPTMIEPRRWPAADPFPPLPPAAPRPPSAPLDPLPPRPRTGASAGGPVQRPFAPLPVDGPAPEQVPMRGWRIETVPAGGNLRTEPTLPAWPTFLEEPVDDAPGWPSIERRLERSRRLDLEQRRR